MATATTFPRELADLVTDNLADAPEELAACTLIGRVWLPSARRHLFRTLAVTPANYAALAAHLQTPSNADTVTPHVRRIRIGMPAMLNKDNGDDVGGVDDENDEDDEDDNNNNDEEAKKITLKFQELERLLPHEASFAIVRDVAARTQLEAVHVESAHPDIFYRTVVTVGRLSSITEFAIYTDVTGAVLDDVVQLVCAFPLLHKLSIRGSMSVPASFTGAGYTLSLHLHTLTLDVGVALPWFTKWLAGQGTPALQTVCIPTEHDEEHLQLFLDTVGLSLTALYTDASNLTDLDLSRNTNLRTLSVIYAAVGRPSFPTTALAGLESALALPILSTVVLDFATCEEFNARGLVEQSIHVLDRVIARFPALRTVRVQLPPGCEGREEVEDAEVLRECQARGVVEYTSPYEVGTYGV